MKELLREMFNDTYSQTVKDNKEDYMSLYGIIAKLVSCLKVKELLTDDEMEFILKTDILEELKGGKE